MSCKELLCFNGDDKLAYRHVPRLCGGVPWDASLMGVPFFDDAKIKSSFI